MIYINLQIEPGYRLKPASPEDLESLKEFGVNQIVKARLQGHKKPRSVAQNRWLHAMFKIVADNSEDVEWNTPEKVKRMVKMLMHFFDTRFVVGDKVFFELRSFSFDSLGQDEANRIFNKAKELCAKKLNIDPELLESQAKELPF